VNPIYDLLRADGSIVVNKNLIFSIGLNESIIYAELVSRFNYFADRGSLEDDGYFYNTISDLQSGTGLGEKPQRSAIKNLEKIGLIDIDRRGMPPKRYFAILDNEVLLKDLLKKGKVKQAETLATSQLRHSGGIKGSQVAETKTLYGRANNTKSKNTKHNTNHMGIPSDDANSCVREKAISFSEYKLKYVVGDFEEESIEYYLELFKRHKKKDHPKLTSKKWSYIVDTWFYLWDSQRKTSVDNDIYVMENIINAHFKTKYTSGDHSMIHFLSGEIKINRYYETKYDERREVN